MKRNRKHRHRKRRIGILACVMALVLCLSGCSPVGTVLGVGKLYGDTTSGLILVLLDSGELTTMDGKDPTNQIYIGHHDRPEDDPEGDNSDADDGNGSDSQDPSGDTGNDSDSQDPSADTADGRDNQDPSGDTADGRDNQDPSADTADGSDSQDPSGDTGNGSGSQNPSGDIGNDTDGQNPTDFRKPIVQDYAYETLETKEQEAYDRMLTCIRDMDKAVVIEDADADTVNKISTAILADHGDLFWYGGAYQYSEYDKNGTKATSFMPDYSMTEVQRDAVQKQIDSKITDWLSGISTKASDYEKVKYVYQLLVDKVTYDLSADNNQNIQSAFLNERTVCAGFAHAAQVMLQKLGVSCTYLTGDANGGPHAWNMVVVDGVYYYMDVTWGNPSYLNAAGTGEPDYVDYSYMNMTYEEISKDHTCDNSFPLPESNATEANYFVMEGRYFDSDDFSKVGAVVKKAHDAGQNVQIKFSTDALYAKALNELIIQNGLFKYCSDLGQYTYSFRENTRTLYFFFDTSVL